MPRRLRQAAGGYAYHVINRAVARHAIFESNADHEAFVRVIIRMFVAVPMRVLGYVLMPNHWHFVLWPQKDGQLSELMRLLTVTHTQRWHANRHTAGTGPLYQGRFKSFPIQADDHLTTLLRYVERNPLRANLVERAQAWRWGSAYHNTQKARPDWLMDPPAWPVERRADWAGWVNRPQTGAEEEAVRLCVSRGRPFGTEGWASTTAARLGPESTFVKRGRPRAASVDAR